MKALLILLSIWTLSSGPTEISKTNKLKKDAEAAFSKGDYVTAAAHYSTLYDSMNVDDPAIGLNKAHSYYRLGDTAQAKLSYQNVASTSTNKQLKSIAYQQLGVINDKPESLKESLQYFKEALKADPTNQQARYNYEVVKKKLENQQKQNQDQQNQDQDNKDQDNKDQQQQQDQNKDQQGEQDQQKQDQQKQDQEGEKDEQKQQEGKEGEKSEEQKEQQAEGEEKKEDGDKDPQSVKEKLEKMNISEEKAKMILEALRNNEVQYIQQQKRKPTKAQDSSKPDW